MSEAIRYERLERVTWQRREWHPVGKTRAEMAACMDWVRSLGHEAKSLEDDGFRYRSVYKSPTYNGSMTSNWQWTEPGDWLMHMVGENQDPELDSPHEGPPDDDESWGLPRGGWHRVPPITEERAS